MKSTVNVFIRISLTLLFCLGMLITANPAAFAQRDRDRDRDRGNRESCKKECGTDTSSKSATARIEEARNGTDASREQIGIAASAKTTAGTRVLAKSSNPRSLTLDPASLSMTVRLLRIVPDYSKRSLMQTCRARLTEQASCLY